MDLLDGLVQGIESRAPIAALRAAYAVILVNVGDLPAGPLGNLAQLALLVRRGLVDRRNPEIENRAFHGSPPKCVEAT